MKLAVFLGFLLVALVVYQALVFESLRRCLYVHEVTGVDVHWTQTGGCKAQVGGKWVKL